MMVFDLATDHGTQRVAAFGSCRVSTPLAHAAQRGALTWVWGDTALTHTPLQVEQNLRFVQADPGLSPFQQNLIYALPTEPPPPGLLESIDVFLAEFCENQQICVDGMPVQINRMYGILEQHPAALLDWWVGFQRTGRIGCATIARAIAGLRDSPVDHRDELEAMLGSATSQPWDRASLRAAVEVLVEAWPGRWILVSHFATSGDHGSGMTQRRELASWVADAAHRIGAQFLDPSVLVARTGRKIALDAGGADIHHYAEPFMETVAEAYLDLVRTPKKGRPTRRQRSFTAPAILTHAIPRRIYTAAEIEAAATYALQCADMYKAKLMRLDMPLAGSRILEIGSGKDFGAIAILAAAGAEVAVADRTPAQWNDALHPALYRTLRAGIPGRADLLDAFIEAGGHEPLRTLAEPAESLSTFDDDSFDAVISLAVLQQVQDPRAVFTELTRITRKGGVGVHQIDLRDRADFTKPLEFLLLEDEDYPPDLYRRRGNRMRHNEWMQVYREAGFTLVRHNVNVLAAPDYIADFLPRLAACASRFRDLEREDLLTLSVRVGLRLGSE